VTPPSGTTRLPARARVVVVGGGVIGASVAYHLAEAGWTDVLLLERDRLTSGTTWHAAGLVCTFGSMSQTSTRMRQYTRDLYVRLAAETGQDTGFRPVGYLPVATDPERLEELRRAAVLARHLGVDVHEVGADDVARLFPLATTDDVLAGFYVPGDGRANPVDVTMALAAGARRRGVTLVEGCPVTGVVTAAGPGGRPGVAAVRTAEGDVEAEYVVVCAGMWTRQLAARSGVALPLQAAEHYYLITEPIDGVDRSWPVLEDPARFGYFREEGGGLMVGLFEPEPAAWQVGGVPADASFVTLPPDWDRMAPFVARALSRVPAAADAGIRTFFCGPESFTPDGAPLVGETAEVDRYFVAAGLNSVGVLTAGGVGQVVARWIVDGRPDVDVTAIHVDRVHPYQANPAYRATRAVESLGLVYAAHLPGRSPATARGARRSPLHDRLVAAGAWMRDTGGWESPDWYDPGGAPRVDRLSWGREPWFAHWAAEHRAARDGVVVMDMSFMAKLLVQGRDAGLLLERLSANRVGAEPGVITYTQWLDAAGTIEADVTVTVLDATTFWVVASDTAHRHVLARLRRCAGELAVAVTDVTGGWAQLTLQGPRSRELLAGLTSADLRDEAFPFRAAREIDLGLARVLCTRITYVGELGYELFVPAEQAVHVHELLVGAGAAVGLRHAGLKALGSLRLEKGYRDYGHDIDNTDTPLEAGLGFAVAWDKPGGFVGRDALLARRAAGPPARRLVHVLITDPAPLLFHGEVVLRDGADVGYVRAGSYGWTLGGAVGLAMLDAGDEPVTQAWLDAAELHVDVAGTRYPARASLRPLYDPAGARVRG
jgi:4-methylaminobutanoate oxidase (formaldehyde-forming)